MRNFIIGVCVIVGIWQAAGLLGSPQQARPSETFLRLTAPPGRSVASPVDNGYFMLLGLTARHASDPVQAGYDIWFESNRTGGRNEFDLEKPGRFELRISVAPDIMFPEWNAPMPLAELHSRQTRIRTTTSAYRILLARYDQWLHMRFDDWGFAHRGAPRIDDLLTAHRLYVLEGFLHQPRTGVERLVADLARWRLVLREARTIAMKVTAQVLLEDDVMMLSRILNEDPADRTVVTRALEHLQPLTPSEYSLRWPMQSEFVLGYARRHSIDTRAFSPGDQTMPATDALARAARLYPEDFRHIQFGHGSTFFGLAANQRMWNDQAMRYDATIRVVEVAPGPRSIRARHLSRNDRTPSEQDTAPLEFNPAWEPFEQRLAETDTRLRLVSLQILMRKPTATITVPTRLAEVGSHYFDPFTGFPMLWSPTQHKLYSVGKDGLDDGGDSVFDISVPLTGAHAPSTRQASASRTTNPS